MSRTRTSSRLLRVIRVLRVLRGKGMGEAEVETALSSAITIFRYVQDKHIFQVTCVGVAT